MTSWEEQVMALLRSQKQEWQVVHDNYAALKQIQVRRFTIGEQHLLLQFNPERIRSSAAKVGKDSLAKRSCFLCHRPLPQKGIDYSESFEILVNPYPIFRTHLTLPLRWHDKQQIRPFYRDLLNLAVDLPSFALFYNGPKCGASAPDHMHFQAAEKLEFPVVNDWQAISKQLVWENGQTRVYFTENQLPVTCFCVSSHLEEAVSCFERLYDLMPIRPGDDEPMMNLLVWREGENWVSCLFLRRALRPSCYYEEGEANILISPATVEMAGLFVVPLEKDFQKVTAADLQQIWYEVSITKEEKHNLIQSINEI